MRNCYCDGLYGYEDAPATRLLATYCSVCGRPLVDAVSVQHGIGPDCKKKYGFFPAVNPEAWAEANKLIYQIALQQDGFPVAQAAERLKALGFDKVANRILRRVADVIIVDAGHVPEAGMAGYKVAWDYNEMIQDNFARMVPRAYRVWLKPLTGEKVWLIDYRAKQLLFSFLKTNYKGAILIGPKGPFTV